MRGPLRRCLLCDTGRGKKKALLTLLFRPSFLPSLAASIHFRLLLHSIEDAAIFFLLLQPAERWKETFWPESSSRSWLVLNWSSRREKKYFETQAEFKPRLYISDKNRIGSLLCFCVCVWCGVVLSHVTHECTDPRAGSLACIYFKCINLNQLFVLILQEKKIYFLLPVSNRCLNMCVTRGSTWQPCVNGPQIITQPPAGIFI